MSEGTGTGSKIVFVNRYFHPDESATSQLLTDLAFSLVESGYRVQVICCRQRYDDARARLAPSESVGGVHVRRVWTTRFGRRHLLGRAIDYATFYCSSATAMLACLRRGDTIVAKTDPPLISITAMMAAKLRGAHLINWLQDIFPEVASLLGANPLPRPLDALLRRWRDYSLRSAVCNVVLGERMRERLQHRGIPGEQIRVIENWAGPDMPQPIGIGMSGLRSRLCLRDKFVVGYSGNLGRAHEFETLLAAAGKLQADGEFLFLMIGGGAAMIQLSRAVDERRLKNFRFLPYQPRESLSDALAAADVHWLSLLPALEGYIVPSKFYGILAAARPTIFIGDTDGEVARIIHRAHCGVVISVQDVDALVDELRRLRDDPALRDRMAHNGHRRYRELYSVQRAVAQWMDVLGPRARDIEVKLTGPAAASPSREPSNR